MPDLARNGIQDIHLRGRIYKPNIVTVVHSHKINVVTCQQREVANYMAEMDKIAPIVTAEPDLYDPYESTLILGNASYQALLQPVIDRHGTLG